MSGTPVTNFQLADDEQATFPISFKDDQGNDAPAPAGIAITAALSDSTVASATVAPDNSSVTVVTTGKLGIGEQVTVSDGTITSAPFTFDVVASGATSIALGAPQVAKRP